MAVKASAQITIMYVVDVKATYRYYLLQSSTLSTPSKPTTYPPASTWDDTEPSYVDGSTNTLYFVDCTVFNDNTFVYSEVSKSSSYEAAKSAYNKAVNAENTANTTQENLDKLTIGGRNLYVGSADFSGDSWVNISEYSEDGRDSLNNVVLTKTNAWLGLFQEIEAKAGEQYTLSANVRGDGTATLWFYISEVSTDGNETTKGVKDYGVAPTIETRFSETWQVAEDSTIKFRIENSIGGQNLWVSSIKLEKGNKATDWTPAPEDVDEKILEVDDTATQAKDTAEATRNELIEAQSIIQTLQESISMLVTDGNGVSLMTQTADGGWTFSMGEISSTLDKTVNDLDDLVKEVGDVDSTVEILNNAVNDLEILNDYINIGTYNDQPCIELGERDNDFLLRITNTEIHFADGTIIDREKINIGKANVKELQQGGFVWVLHGNNMGLMWKGVDG